MCNGQWHIAAFDDDGRFSRHDVFVVTCIAYSALTLAAWEWITNLEFEAEFLANSTRRWMKVLYCISRYLGIAIQIVNTRFIASMRGVYCPPPGLCSRWFAMHAVIACMLLVQLEVLLMTEVYAMYDRKLRIKVLLTAVMTSKSIAMAAIVASVCREVVFEDVSCVVQAMPVPALALCGLEIATAFLIIGLTLHRYRYTILRNSGQPIPLLRLVLRDSAISFTIITGLFLAILVDTKTVGEACRVILPVTSSITSLSTTRIIRNLRRFRNPDACSCDAGDLQLTSVRSHRSCSFSQSH